MADRAGSRGGADWMAGRERRPVDLRTDRPHPARVYDVLLGGKTNYAADREAAERTVAAVPNAELSARQNRAFMHRAVRHLAESGVRQFLDIGTGIPTSPNLHEVAQSVVPSARIVYADNDPIVLTHSRALHTSHPLGRTSYVDADLSDPEDILAHPDLRRTLDLAEPVALTLMLILQWLPAGHDAYAVVDRLMDALPSGSHLVISHATHDFDPPALARIADHFAATGSHLTTRSRGDVLRFFEGMELVDPGVVPVQEWRPGTADIAGNGIGGADVPVYAGVARKR